MSNEARERTRQRKAREKLVRISRTSVVLADGFNWSEVRTAVNTGGEGVTLPVANDARPADGCSAVGPWLMPGCYGLSGGRLQFVMFGNAQYLPPAGRPLLEAIQKALEIANTYGQEIDLIFSRTVLQVWPRRSPESLVEAYCNLNRIDVPAGYAAIAAAHRRQAAAAREQREQLALREQRASSRPPQRKQRAAPRDRTNTPRLPRPEEKPRERAITLDDFADFDA